MDYESRTYYGRGYVAPATGFVPSVAAADTPGLDFSDADNSQYIALLLEDV